MPEFKEHEAMAELFHDFISPTDELESKGIGDPVNHTLYRPDAFWKVGGRWVCVEVEKKPFFNKLEAKLRKAHAALREVRGGWEPSKDKIKLWPVLDDLRRRGLEVLIGIPERYGDYVKTRAFQAFLKTSHELGIGVSLYLIGTESKEVSPAALPHFYGP